MKKLKFMIILGAILVISMIPVGVMALEEGESVDINDTNFPDGVFREYVKSEYDKDSDGVLTYSETISVTEIDIQSKGIKDLTGIKYFGSLETLICSFNPLTKLDVSGLPLKHLECIMCGEITGEGLIDAYTLTELDISGCVDLEKLYCQSNLLTELDLSTNTNLKILNCTENKLTHLNVRSNTMLEELSCGKNDIEALDVSGLKKLRDLHCRESGKLKEINLTGCTSLIKIQCELSALTSLDVSSCSKLTMLVCYSNPITQLNITNNKDLRNLRCEDTNIEAMHLNDILQETYEHGKKTELADGSVGYQLSDDATMGQSILRMDPDMIILETYTVTFDFNGGNLFGHTEDIIVPLNDNGNLTDNVPYPTREGYEFVGWYTAEDKLIENPEDYVYEGSITLYAKWAKEQAAAENDGESPDTGDDADLNGLMALLIGSVVMALATLFVNRKRAM